MQARIKLPQLAAACDRTGISDRSASMIVSSVLQDIGLISRQDSSKVIDRSKIRRERKKYRTDIQKSSGGTDISGIYFDGRKDQTLVLENWLKVSQKDRD